MRNIYKYGLMMFLLSSLCFSCDNEDADIVYLKTENPVATVESIYPTVGYAGAEFTITGTEFGIMKNAIKAYIGEDQLEVLSCTDNEIVVKIPEGATAGKITVEVFGQTIATDLVFDVLGEPGVTEIVPVYGFPGDAIAFNGHDLGVSKSMYKVIFTGTEKTASLVDDPTNDQFIVRVPEDATSGMIKLNISDKAVNVPLVNGFTILEHATVTGMKSQFGYSGSEIVIQGTNLKQNLLENKVSLLPIRVVLAQGENKVSAEIDNERTTNDAIVAKLPSSVATGEYIVYVSTSFEDVPMEEPLKYVIAKTPVVEAISSSQALAGSEVVLTCKNMEGVTKESVNVLLGETPAEVKSVDGDKITFAVPSLPKGIYTISLIINGASIDLGEQALFTVLSTPVILSINKDCFLHNESTVLVKTGDEVIISGQEFGTSLQHAVLKFGDVKAEISSIKETEIRAVVPIGFNSGTVSLSVNGMETSLENVTLKVMNAGEDITEYVLKNYKQPFQGTDGFDNKREWDTLLDWQRNDVLVNAGIGCLQYPKIDTGRDANGTIALQRWGYKNIKNGKLYQMTKLPAGNYKVWLSGISSGVSSGYVRCVFAVFSGNAESQIVEYGDSADYPENASNMLGKVKLAPDVLETEVCVDFTLTEEKMNDVIFSFISWCHNTVWVNCNSIKVEFVGNN